MYGLSMEYLRRKREGEWRFITSNIKNQFYHSCYSFFIVNFALAKSKTVRQPLRADTHFLLRASLSLHSQKIYSRYLHPTGIAYEDNKIVFIYDNDLHDIIFMRITLSLFG